MAQTYFPSPAEDLGSPRLDVADLLQAHKPDTFFMRVADTRWRHLGVLAGDVVVVRRSKPPRPGQLVVACRNGELVLERLTAQHQGRGRVESSIEIWGVVTAAIHLLEP